ncbi:MAG: MFS transporter [Kiloniellaceae bacterium]|nr:MFS transporter [Kiloniellaceae bacterium]
MSRSPREPDPPAGPPPFDPAPPAPAGPSFFRIFFSIMLPMFLAVVDQTIVATALPAIAGSLGGVERISWIVVAYLVATTVAAPVYGQLGDLLGRRRLLVIALVFFITASLLCAVSTSIEMLIAMRILQGLGGGGLMTLSQALVGETVPPRERAHYQGYLAAVMVSSSTFGPVAGGFLTEHLGWQSVFLVNLPIGVLAIFLATRLPKRAGSGAPFRFDLLGALLFAVFIASALVLLEQIRRFDAALLPLVLGLTSLVVVSLVLLAWREKVAPDPMLPVALLRNPTTWRSDALAACHGAILVSLLTFLPIYLRVVGGASPAETGLLLLPMTIGVGIGSMVTGRAISRTGRTAIFPSLGLIFVVLGLVVVGLWSRHMSSTQLAGFLGLTAIFMGTVMGVVQVTIQSTAGPGKLGAAAATVQFSRALGAALGTAVVGSVLFAALAGQDPATAGLFGELLQGGADRLAALPAATRAVVEGEVADAFRAAFLSIAGFAALALILAWSIPLRRI